jgi:hypothetical protein
MEKVGIFYGDLEYITAVLYILWPFGNLVAIFPRCWYTLSRKIWQPWPPSNPLMLYPQSTSGRWAASLPKC